MPILKKKSENEEIATLQAEVDRLKAFERIRLKYGRISDKDVERILKEEENAAAKAEMRKIAEEESRKAREERDRKIREEAVKLVQQGRVLVTVGGVRAESIGKDLTPPCPHCGGGLSDADQALYEYTEWWLFTPADRRFVTESPLMIYSAKNPLSRYMGAPLWVGAGTCRNCKKTAFIVVQLVIL